MESYCVAGEGTHRVREFLRMHARFGLIWNPRLLPGTRGQRRQRSEERVMRRRVARAAHAGRQDASRAKVMVVRQTILASNLKVGQQSPTTTARECCLLQPKEGRGRGMAWPSSMSLKTVAVEAVTMVS